MEEASGHRRRRRRHGGSAGQNSNRAGTRLHRAAGCDPRCPRWSGRGRCGSAAMVALPSLEKKGQGTQGGAAADAIDPLPWLLCSAREGSGGTDFSFLTGGEAPSRMELIHILRAGPRGLGDAKRSVRRPRRLRGRTIHLRRSSDCYPIDVILAVGCI